MSYVIANALPSEWYAFQLNWIICIQKESMTSILLSQQYLLVLDNMIVLVQFMSSYHFVESFNEYRIEKESNSPVVPILSPKNQHASQFFRLFLFMAFLFWQQNNQLVKNIALPGYHLHHLEKEHNICFISKNLQLLNKERTAYVSAYVNIL